MSLLKATRPAAQVDIVSATLQCGAAPLLKHYHICFSGSSVWSLATSIITGYVDLTKSWITYNAGPQWHSALPKLAILLAPAQVSTFQGSHQSTYIMWPFSWLIYPFKQRGKIDFLQTVVLISMFMLQGKHAGNRCGGSIRQWTKSKKPLCKGCRWICLLLFVSTKNWNKIVSLAAKDFFAGVQCVMDVSFSVGPVL